MKSLSSALTSITRNLLPTSTAHTNRPEPKSPKAASAPAPVQGNVGYAFNRETGDPNRNLYAPQMKDVLATAITGQATSQRLISEYNAEVFGTITSTGPVATGSEQPQAKRYAMEPIYLEAGKRFEAFLAENGFPVPNTIKKGKLTYAEDDALRARQVAFSEFGWADADPDMLKLSKRDIKTRMKGERELGKYKNLFNYAKAKLALDVDILTDLFAPVAEKNDVELKLVAPDEFSNFFARNFGIRLSDEVNDAARRAFDEALKKDKAADRQAGGNDHAGRADQPVSEVHRREALSTHLEQLLGRLPLGTGKKERDGEHLPVAKQGLFKLAESVARERVVQAKVAETSGQNRFAVSGGSSFVVKGAASDNFDFMLEQPYGQRDFKPCTYELRFRENEGRHELEMRTVHITESGPSAPEILPLTGTLADNRATLEQHFSKSDLALLFGRELEGGDKGFSELFGRLKAKQMQDAKIEDVVFQHLDSEIKAHFEKEGITSIQGTGYFYNKGLYGKDFLTDMRGPFNERMMKLLESGQLAATGSCGFQQDLIFGKNGKIIAVPNVTGENYLNSAHGNDPHDVEESQTTHAIEPNTARAAEYESQVETEEYDPRELRLATPGAPISQRENRGVLKAPGITDAARRNLWTPRENVPLSVPVITVAKEGDRTEEAIRHYQFTNSKGQPVIASAHLALSHAIDADGNRVDLKDGAINEDDLKNYQRLHLSHMLPEGWVLRDDEHKIVLDPDTQQPVRLLEEVVVRPVPRVKPMRVPDTVEMTVKAKDAEQPGAVRTIKVERYLNEVTGRHILEKRDEFGDPVREFNEHGMLERVFVYQDGKPVEGEVKAKPLHVMQQTETSGFEIVSIERWTRKPIPDPRKPGTVKTRGDQVLCTFVKSEQSADAGNLDTSILRDRIFTTINCVHSQNGLHTETVDDTMGTLDIVGHSYKAGDTSYGYDQIMAVSKDRPWPHPVSVPRGVPRQALIAEDVAFSLGGGTGASASQPHRDMDNSNVSPYTLDEFKKDIPEEQRGQRYGNQEAISQGHTLKGLRQHREALEKAAGEARKRRKQFVNDEIITPLIKEFGRLDLVEATPWTRYGLSRSHSDLAALIDPLNAIEHSLAKDCAKRLGYQKAYLDEVMAATDALHEQLSAIKDAIGDSLPEMREKTSLDARLAQIAAMRSHLHVLAMRYTQEDASGGPGAFTVAESLKAIVSNFEGLQTDLARYCEKKIASLARKGTEETSEPLLALRVALTQCKHAMAGLTVWENQPEMIREELAQAVEALKQELDKDWDTDEMHPLLHGLVEGRQGNQLSRNNKVANRYYEGSGEQIHQLLALRDLDDLDANAFAARKEEINTNLSETLAALHTSKLGVMALAGTDAFNRPEYDGIQEEIKRITAAQTAYRDSLEMVAFSGDVRTARIAEMTAELTEWSEQFRDAVDQRLSAHLVSLRADAASMASRKGSHTVNSIDHRELEEKIAAIDSARRTYALGKSNRMADGSTPDAQQRTRMTSALDSWVSELESSVASNGGSQATMQEIESLLAQRDRIRLQRGRIAAWKAFDRQAIAMEAQNERPAASLIRTGKVAPLEQLHAGGAAHEEADTESIGEALLPQTLMTLLSEEPGEERDKKVRAACRQLLETEISSDLVDTRLPQEEQVNALFSILSNPAAPLFVQLNETAGIMGEQLQDALKGLTHIVDSARSASDKLPDDGLGRNRYHYSYPQRGRGVPSAALAGMAMNAPVNATFSAVKEIVNGFTGHVPDALELGAAGAAVALDAFPGGITIAAGAAMAKDGIFTHGRLKPLQKLYRDRLAQYQEIQGEIAAMHQEIAAAINGASGLDLKGQQKALKHVAERFDRRIQTLQARLQRIDEELQRALIDTMSGAALAGAGTAGLGGAIANLAGTAGVSGATAAGVAASALGMAAGGLLTVLGAFQLGLSVKDYLHLRDVTVALHEERGRGPDSGLRRAHMQRRNELMAAQMRKIRLWVAFTGGSAALVAGGAVTATGVAAPAGIALSIGGGLAVGSSVAALFIEPRHLRNRTGRSADNTAGTRDHIINNDALLNQFLHKNANQAARAAETIREIVDKSFDQTPRALSSSSREFRRQFTKTATVKSWFDIDIHRRELRNLIAGNTNATKDAQINLMFYTNVQELNYLKQEMAAAEEEMLSVTAMRFATTAMIKKNMVRITELQASGTRSQQQDETQAGAAADTTSLNRKEEDADAQEKKLIARIENLDSAASTLSAQLQRIRARHDAVNDLQHKLTMFGAELDRNLGGATRAQFDELRLRFMLSNDLLVSAMGRDDAKSLAHAYHQEKLGEKEGARFLTAHIDGKIFDGTKDVGPVPSKGKLERIDFIPNDACVQWLMGAAEDNGQPRVGDINQLFATAMCFSLPDRCAEERNVLLDMHTERLKLELADKRKAEKQQKSAAANVKPDENADGKSRMRRGFGSMMNRSSLPGMLRRQTKQRPSEVTAAPASGEETTVSRASSVRTDADADARIADTRKRRSATQGAMPSSVVANA